MTDKSDHYTLVRHTGYTGTGHTDFKNAVESRGITAREAERVRSAGGLVFTDYANATKAEEATNYPPGTEGLVPRATGTFVSRVLDEQLYIPPAREVRTCKATDHTLDVIEMALDIVIARPGTYADALRTEAEPVRDIVRGWRK